jgi:gas vesicle protein
MKMTANELADALEDKSIRYSESVQDWLDEAKNMLRQQAQEIKNRNMDIDALRTFNNDLETEIETLKKELALNYIVRGISKESE